MSLIEVQDVYQNFRIGKKDVEVLKGLSCNIEENEFVVVLGKSGSGKTTFLNILGGLDKPTFGNVTIDGVNLSDLTIDQLSHWRASTVGIIFQSYNLMPYMTALDNVALPLAFMGINKKRRYEQASLLLKAVGLKCRLDSSSNLLSGGEQQRVTIARALINKPKILIADEPTGDLDSENAEAIMQLLYSFYRERKTTIIMATHNLEFVKYADKVINVKEGIIECAKKTRTYREIL